MPTLCDGRIASGDVRGAGSGLELIVDFVRLAASEPTTIFPFESRLLLFASECDDNARGL